MNIFRRNAYMRSLRCYTIDCSINWNLKYRASLPGDPQRRWMTADYQSEFDSRGTRPINWNLKSCVILNSQFSILNSQFRLSMIHMKAYSGGRGRRVVSASLCSLRQMGDITLFPLAFLCNMSSFEPSFCDFRYIVFAFQMW